MAWLASDLSQLVEPCAAQAKGGVPEAGIRAIRKEAFNERHVIGHARVVERRQRFSRLALVRDQAQKG